MYEPVILGDVMKEYLLLSEDDFAKAFRELYKEHGSDFLTSGQPSCNTDM